MGRSRSIEAVKAILPDFKAAYMGRPPVIGAGLGAEYTKRGSQRIVFRAYLKSDPIPDQQRTLKKTFRRVPIKYGTTGPIVAAGVAEVFPGEREFAERFPDLLKHKL